MDGKGYYAGAFRELIRLRENLTIVDISTRDDERSYHKAQP